MKVDFNLFNPVRTAAADGFDTTKQTERRFQILCADCRRPTDAQQMFNIPTERPVKRICATCKMKQVGNFNDRIKF